MHSASIQAHFLRYKAWYLGLGFVAFLAFLGLFLDPVDHLPLVWAIRIELAGGSAYGSEMSALFHEYFNEPYASGGFAYPLTAIWFALPIAFLPDILLNIVACIFCLGSVFLGLHLLRMPMALVLCAPILWGISYIQLTTCLFGLTLIAIWAARERRWRLMIILVILITATKPQTTLLPGLLLAIYALREGQWKLLTIISLIVISVPFLLEPDWIPKWIASTQRYTSEISNTWLYYLLPFGVWFIWKRHWWASVGILQIALFPMVVNPYVLSPLLLAYIPLKSNKYAWIVVVCSWCGLILSWRIHYGLAIIISYLIPIYICYWLKKVSPETDNSNPIQAFGSGV